MRKRRKPAITDSAKLVPGMGTTPEREAERRRKISEAMMGKERPKLRGHPSYALRRGPKHCNWKGGRRLNGGYVCVLRRDHPNAPKAGYIREHILVMEAHLGRYLKPGENVHHRNGIRHDNRIENLELWVRPQNPGQRVADIIAWVVKDYRDEILKELGK